jgi:hypothetical protein
MKIIKTAFIALLVLGMTNVQAQKIKVKSGDLGFLKGQTEVLVQFDYSDMAVGKFDKEEDYVAKKVEEYNKAEAGKGDNWKENWIADRKNRFQPKFDELINKYTSKVNCDFDESNENATYLMIVKTTFTEPGWNIGISRRDAMINVTVLFVEKANTNNVLAEMTISNIPGRTAMGGDYDTGLRISEAYAMCGKALGSYLVKKAF